MTTTAPPAGPVRRNRSETLFGRHPVGMILAAPYAVHLAVVFAYPFAFSVWISFHDYFFAAPGVVVDHPFAGLDNYRAVLSDPAVRQAFRNILVFLVVNVPLTTGLALVLAVALDRVVHARTFLRVAFYLPYVTASVAVVGVWLFLFSSGGLVNTLLGPLAPEPSWLVNANLAMPVIALFVTWKQLGFFILLYLAALQNVPGELYESASVDGANGWHRFWSVTVPAVRPATALVVILGLITGANLFTEPYLLTGGGGPSGASASPVLVMYQRGLQQGEPDFAAALGVVLVAGVLVVAYVNRRFLEGRD
ncbi:carbohydrate ABC transporter permease [Actinoplanes siamensis]|uniref:ABC transporter permease n=1 Tax=Actinoplanes siamensis TaxID=1223317 RepID=A0A919N3W3_9ACTN|nr:sugar ABC transporter permease [Actinoplanes siamensis]GIF03911.1 ABC transporter permease [Actinoplanes siamensis]